MRPEFSAPVRGATSPATVPRSRPEAQRPASGIAGLRLSLVAQPKHEMDRKEYLESRQTYRFTIAYQAYTGKPFVNRETISKEPLTDEEKMQLKQAVLELRAAYTASIPRFQLFVKGFDGKTHTIEAERLETMRTVITRISNKIDVPLPRLRVIWSGIQFDVDETRVEEHDIMAESTFHALARLTGD